MHAVSGSDREFGEVRMPKISPTQLKTARTDRITVTELLPFDKTVFSRAIGEVACPHAYDAHHG
jgi:hypothetical protein